MLPARRVTETVSNIANGLSKMLTLENEIIVIKKP